MENHSMIKGKIVLVTFPFDDFSQAKVRPAICLTEPIGHHRHVVLAFISSKVPQDLLETDVVLDSNSAGFVSTGLRVSSVIRLHRLMTVSTALIQRELGDVSQEMQIEIDKKLMKLFGLMHDEKGKRDSKIGGE